MDDQPPRERRIRRLSSSLVFQTKTDDEMHSRQLHHAFWKPRESTAADLRSFYAAKYTPLESRPRAFAVQMYRAMSGPEPNAAPITCEELQTTLATTKAGKSTGADGIPYELMFSVLQSPLETQFLLFFNSILHGVRPIPEAWLPSQVVFLPKQKNRRNRRTCDPLCCLRHLVSCSLNCCYCACGTYSLP